MSVKSLEVNLNNVPSSGKISFSGGIPTISFTISAQNALLNLSSIRLCGRLHHWANSAGTAVPTLMASEKLGVYGTMSQLVWRHSRSKQVIENISHYAEFLGSGYLPVQSSEQDSQSHLGETALIVPSYQQFQNSVIRNDESGSSFCIPLISGLTMGTGTLNLMESAFGGLDCEIHLQPNSQYFFSNTGVDTAIRDCFYEFQDLKVLCEVYVPEIDELSRLMKETDDVFEFNSINSYMTTLQSSNSIVNFQLGLSRVISSYTAFIPSSFVNNLNNNGYAFYLPTKADTDKSVADINDVSFLKMGERFPFQFVIDANVKDSPDTNVCDPQIIKYFADALIPENQHLRTSMSPITTNRGYSAKPAVINKVPSGGAIYAVGCNYDKLNSDGVNFKNQSFTVQMSTGLNDGNPVSAYLFVKAKNTIAWNANGIQVTS